LVAAPFVVLAFLLDGFAPVLPALQSVVPGPTSSSDLLVLDKSSLFVISSEFAILPGPVNPLPHVRGALFFPGYGAVCKSLGSLDYGLAWWVLMLFAFLPFHVHQGVLSPICQIEENHRDASPSVLVFISTSSVSFHPSVLFMRPSHIRFLFPGILVLRRCTDCAIL